jgi:precorrin-6B methylase 2
MPTPVAVIEAAFSILEMGFGLVRGSGQTFIDLGAGTGDVVLFCSKTYRISALGIEINHAFVRLAQKSIRAQKLKNARVWKGDLFDHPLGMYDFIFIFALPHIQRFLKHVFESARHGAIVFTYKYPLDQLDALLTLRHEAAIQINGITSHLFFYEKN